MANKRENKYQTPSALTLQKVKRIQAMVDENYPPLAACQAVGLSVSAFYSYRKQMGLGPWAVT